jgi:hypothetical protein
VTRNATRLRNLWLAGVLLGMCGLLRPPCIAAAPDADPPPPASGAVVLSDAGAPPIEPSGDAPDPEMLRYLELLERMEMVEDLDLLMDES